jgi:metal-sulfur cluster biosynthetic enzyme
MDVQNPGMSQERVLDALGGVTDPELGPDFVTLGLIYDVEIRAGEVDVVFWLTSPGGPIGAHVTGRSSSWSARSEGCAA